MSQRTAQAKPSKSSRGRQRVSAEDAAAIPKRRTKSGLMPTVSSPAVLDSAGGGDRAFRQLLYDISIAASHLESARAYLASHLGVTSPQYNMIMVIAQYEGSAGLSVNEIADHLHVSGTFVTAEIKKLVRLGMVIKEPNPADARSVLIRLSEEGDRQVRAIHPELLFVNDHLFEHISQSDFKALSRIIASLIHDFSRTVAMLQVVAQSSKGDKERNGISRALNRASKRTG